MGIKQIYNFTQIQAQLVYLGDRNPKKQKSIFLEIFVNLLFIFMHPTAPKFLIF